MWAILPSESILAGVEPLEWLEIEIGGSAPICKHHWWGNVIWGGAHCIYAEKYGMTDEHLFLYVSKADMCVTSEYNS